MLRRFPFTRTLATVCILSLTVQVSAPLFASPTTRGGVKATVSTLSTDNNPSSSKTLAWLGNFWQTIRRDYGGGNVQVAYEYGYGFDGGRRWRKDYVSGVWTRYPCGVACGAGELVEQEKPLDGGQWATSALYLQGISLVRRNSEWHHFDPFGTAGVITNGTASVISRNLYDLFGVLRYEQGSAQTPWRWVTERGGEEGILVSLQSGCIVIPGKLCIGPGCHGNPKCPPAKPKPVPSPPPFVPPSPRPPCTSPTGCISNPPCPPGTVLMPQCGGWCIGSEKGCLLKCTPPMFGGIAGERACQSCCEALAKEQNWSISRLSACQTDCYYYANPPEFYP